MLTLTFLDLELGHRATPPVPEPSHDGRASFDIGNARLSTDGTVATALDAEEPIPSRAAGVNAATS